MEDTVSPAELVEDLLQAARDWSQADQRLTALQNGQQTSSRVDITLAPTEAGVIKLTYDTADLPTSARELLFGPLIEQDREEWSAGLSEVLRLAALVSESTEETSPAKGRKTK